MLKASPMCCSFMDSFKDIGKTWKIAIVCKSDKYKELTRLFHFQICGIFAEYDKWVCKFCDKWSKVLLKNLPWGSRVIFCLFGFYKCYNIKKIWGMYIDMYLDNFGAIICPTHMIYFCSVAIGDCESEKHYRNVPKLSKLVRHVIQLIFAYFPAVALKWVQT